VKFRLLRDSYLSNYNVSDFSSDQCGQRVHTLTVKARYNKGSYVVQSKTTGPNSVQDIIYTMEDKGR
jgi:hypothetical protein